MNNFKSVDDFSIDISKGDVKNYFWVLKQNFETGKQLSNTLKESLEKNFYMAPIGEFFVKITPELQNKLLDLEKYFTLWNWQVGSRWRWYYGLFWDAYKVENRKFDDTKLKEYFESFWEEYDEYVDLLSDLWKIENFEERLLFLDNYRNFLLIWSYVFIVFLQSSQLYKTHPLRSFQPSFPEEFIDKIKSELKKYISLYDVLIDQMIALILKQEIKENNLPDIKKLFWTVKSFFDEKVIKTKKWKKYTFNEFFTQNKSNAKLWFESIFRNNREEDNIGVIFQFFLWDLLQKKTDFSGAEIFNFIEEFKKKSKDDFVLASLYGGIELGSVARYLGYNSAWINYSVYHLWNKSVYLSLPEVIFSLKWNISKAKSVIIVDDNTYTWKTLAKLDTLLQNSHIPVKFKAVPRIGLEKEELEEFKKYDQAWNKVKMKIGQVDLSSLLKLINIKKHIPTITDIKKQVALNADYILPRRWTWNRNINLLVWKKVRWLRKKFGKEMRSL